MMCFPGCGHRLTRSSSPSIKKSKTAEDCRPTLPAEKHETLPRTAKLGGGASRYRRRQAKPSQAGTARLMNPGALLPVGTPKNRGQNKTAP